MVEWLAGNRIRGTSAEKPVSSLQSPSVGGWVEVGRTTLGSTTKPITVSSIPDKRYYMILVDMNKSGNATSNIRVGNTTIDPNNNYADRGSYNGAADGTPRTSVSTHELATASAGVGDFIVGYVANLSAKEKLMQYYWVYNGAINAGTAPERAEKVGKWTNGGVSAVIDTMQLYNSQSGNYLSGSEVVVLGWDPTDTHTTNFWEELASVNWSAGGEIDTGTFASKKYLWVQISWQNTTAQWTYMNFNGDNSATKYTSRQSVDGASDGTVVNYPAGEQYYAILGEGSSDVYVNNFANMFIINNPTSEKLGIINSMLVRDGTVGAGYAPRRVEGVFKYTDTSNAITRIQLLKNSGSYSGGTLKVWGHD